MRPEDRVGAGGVLWDALLANLEEDDRVHAEERVLQSIEDDRMRALSAASDDPFDGGSPSGRS